MESGKLGSYLPQRLGDRGTSFPGEGSQILEREILEAYKTGQNLGGDLHLKGVEK